MPTTSHSSEIDLFFSLGLDMLYIVGTDGYFKRLNKAFVDTLGYSHEDLCARPLTDFIHPEDIAPTLQAIATQKNGGSSVSGFENRYRRKDGTYRWFEWKSSPVGELIYASARDITENRQVQMERDRFFTSSLDLLAISDDRGYFTSVNPVVFDILGYTPEEFCATPYLDMIHPEDLQKTSSEIATQMVGQPITHFENRYRHKDGSYRWISWKSTPIGNVMYGCGARCDGRAFAKSAAALDYRNANGDRRNRFRPAGDFGLSTRPGGHDGRGERSDVQCGGQRGVRSDGR